MKNMTSRRPSPAMLVAIVALVAALVGTASGLPGKSTVDSGDIKPKAVEREDQALDQRTDWALIRFNEPEARIVKQSGGISLAESGSFYAYVDFGRSMAGRPITATALWDSDSSDHPIEAALCGGGAQGVGCAEPGTDDSHHIFVRGQSLDRVYLTVLPE